jgi:hypothetical protein
LEREPNKAMPVFNNNDLQNVVGAFANIFGNPVEENKMRLNTQVLQGRQGVADLFNSGAVTLGPNGIPVVNPQMAGRLGASLYLGGESFPSITSGFTQGPIATSQINAHNAAAGASSSAAALNKQKFQFEQEKYNTEKTNRQNIADLVTQNGGLPTALSGSPEIAQMVASALLSGDLPTLSSSINAANQARDNNAAAKLREDEFKFKQGQYADKLAGQKNLGALLEGGAIRPDGSVDPNQYGKLTSAANSAGVLDVIASLQNMASQAGYHQKQIDLKQKEYDDKLAATKAFSQAVAGGVQAMPSTGRLTLAPGKESDTLSRLASDPEGLKRIVDAFNGGTPLSNVEGTMLQQAQEQGNITPTQGAMAKLYPGQNIAEGSSFVPTPNDPRFKQDAPVAQPAQAQAGGSVVDAFAPPAPQAAPAQSIVPQTAPQTAPTAPQTGGNTPPTSGLAPAGAFDPSRLSKGAAEALSNASQGPARNSVLVQHGNIISNMKVSGVPSELVDKISRTMTFMEQARNAIKALESNPGAVGGLIQRASPGIAMSLTRDPAVADIAGLVQSVAAAKAHELYGGAYTTNEVERSAMFLPNIGKTAKMNADNLRNLYQESAMKLRQMLANLPRGAQIDNGTVSRAGELFMMPQSSLLGGYSGTDATQNIGFMPTPAKRGQEASDNVVKQFFDIAQRDTKLARKMMEAQGWTVPKTLKNP